MAEKKKKLPPPKGIGNISDFYLSQKTPRDRPVRQKAVGPPLTDAEALTKFELKEDEEWPMMWEEGMPHRMSPAELTNTKLGDQFPLMQQWLDKYLSEKSRMMERGAHTGWKDEPPRLLKYYTRGMYSDVDEELDYRDEEYKKYKEEMNKYNEEMKKKGIRGQ